MVNYDWELRYYRGCLIAVSSKCIAYALRGNNTSLSNIEHKRLCFIALSNTEKGVQNTPQKEYFKQNFQLFRKTV